MICDNITISQEGNLCFAGQDTVELSQRFGTPLYLMDDARIRYNCRQYLNAMKSCFDGNCKEK
jgi:diaminopimelate decarboxylase